MLSIDATYTTDGKEDRPARQVSVADRTHAPNFSLVTVIPGRRGRSRRDRDGAHAGSFPGSSLFFLSDTKTKSDQHKPPIHPIPPRTSQQDRSGE